MWTENRINIIMIQNADGIPSDSRLSRKCAALDIPNRIYGNGKIPRIEMRRTHSLLTLKAWYFVKTAIKYESMKKTKLKER